MKTISHLLDCENRRIAPRLKKRVKVAVHDLGGHRLLTHSINISRTGLRVIAESALPEGERLELNVQLDPEDSISFKGRAVWQRPMGDMGVHVAGVAFEPNQQLSTPHLVSWLLGHGV